MAVGKTYRVQIGTLERFLPIMPICDDLAIAVFNLLGDVAATEAAAKALLELAPAFDIILSAEAKSIPLVYEMTRLAGKSHYIIARKIEKKYSKSQLTVPVNAITSAVEQHLHLTESDALYLQHQRILIVDDVISSGSSIQALEHLAHLAQGQVVGKMAVFAEGEAASREDILYLGHLPLFTSA